MTFFIFTPKIGESSHFDSYFSDGLVQPPGIIFYSAKMKQGETVKPKHRRQATLYSNIAQ